jgi:hypothetical protein
VGGHGRSVPDRRSRYDEGAGPRLWPVSIDRARRGRRDDPDPIVVELIGRTSVISGNGVA